MSVPLLRGGDGVGKDAGDLLHGDITLHGERYVIRTVHADVSPGGALPLPSASILA